MNKERDYFFDNLKAVLIFLVVLGHFLLPIHGESVLVVVKRLIYVFHMPLFVFVSGYFAKKIYKNGQYNFKKILYLIKAYIIFVIAIQIVYALCGFRDFSEINFFSQSGAPWYLFAMIVWYITIPVIHVELPIYHGTSEEVLNIAAGHLKGSSLPVGGANTHSVISAHRGLRRSCAPISTRWSWGIHSRLRFWIRF